MKNNKNSLMELLKRTSFEEIDSDFFANLKPAIEREYLHNPHLTREQAADSLEDLAMVLMPHIVKYTLNPHSEAELFPVIWLFTGLKKTEKGAWEDTTQDEILQGLYDSLCEEYLIELAYIGDIKFDRLVLEAITARFFLEIHYDLGEEPEEGYVPSIKRMIQFCLCAGFGDKISEYLDAIF